MPTKAKILVVDDTDENIRQLSSNLTAKRYSVVPAHSGEEGYSLAASERPDIIILDVEMPDGMDGFQTLRKLRADQSTRGNVATYADAARPDLLDWRVRSREKGYLLYSQMIAKPENIHGLYAALRPAEENLQLRVRQLGEGLRVPLEYLYDRKDGEGGGEYLVLHHPFARTILDCAVRRKPINRVFLNEIFDADIELRVLLIASNTAPDIPGVDMEVD